MSIKSYLWLALVSSIVIAILMVAWTAVSPDEGTPEEVAAAIVDEINGRRGRLLPLVKDPELMALAAAHSAAMRESDLGVNLARPEGFCSGNEAVQVAYASNVGANWPYLTISPEEYASDFLDAFPVKTAGFTNVGVGYNPSPRWTINESPYVTILLCG